MKYKNYIFDLYGTLIDIHTDEEQPELWRFLAKYLSVNFGKEYEYRKLRNDYLKICKVEEKQLAAKNGSKYPEIRIEWVFRQLIGSPCPEDEMRRLCVAFREQSRDKLVKYDGVSETLEAIKATGGRVFLLSNAQRSFTEKELSDTGLTQYFDDIFISSDMGIKKPDGDFLSQLINKHGLKKEECVMIGNEVLSDIGVASTVGIDAIYLNTYSHTPEEISRDLKICNADLRKVTIVDDGDIMRVFAQPLDR